MKTRPRRDGPMAALYREAIDICACPFCERKGNMALETHHIVPIARGGAQKDFNNFICLCHRCHRNNDLHSKYGEWLPDLLYWKAFSELLILKTTSLDCDESGFRRVLIDSARRMLEPMGYEYRISHLYEMDYMIPDTQHVLSFDEMLKIDKGRTDARIEESQRRVFKQIKRERSDERLRVKNTPIYWMRTKG